MKTISSHSNNNNNDGGTGATDTHPHTVSVVDMKSLLEIAQPCHIGQIAHFPDGIYGRQLGIVSGISEEDKGYYFMLVADDLTGKQTDRVLAAPVNQEILKNIQIEIDNQQAAVKEAETEVEAEVEVAATAFAAITLPLTSSSLERQKNSTISSSDSSSDTLLVPMVALKPMIKEREKNGNPKPPQCVKFLGVINSHGHHIDTLPSKRHKRARSLSPPQPTKINHKAAKKTPTTTGGRCCDEFDPNDFMVQEPVLRHATTTTTATTATETKSNLLSDF